MTSSYLNLIYTVGGAQRYLSNIYDTKDHVLDIDINFIGDKAGDDNNDFQSRAKVIRLFTILHISAQIIEYH